MKKLVLAFAVVMGFSTVSQAGILLEPYLGYEMGTTKPSDGGKFEGTVLGARIAYTLPAFFWVGIDTTQSMSQKIKDDTTSETAKRSVLGAVVGVDFPILVRAWLSYGLSNSLTLDAGKFEGSQTKLGIGFTGLPFVSLNLEMVKDTFNKFEGNTLTDNLTIDSYVLSVSLPLEF